MKMRIKRWAHTLFGHGRRIDMHRCEVCQGRIDPRGGYLLAHHLPGRFDVRWYMGFASPDPVYFTVMCLPIPLNFIYGFLVGRVYLRLRIGVRGEHLKAAYDKGYEVGQRSGRADSYMAQASFNELRDLARKHFPPKDTP